MNFKANDENEHLAFRQIGRWRRELLVGPFSVLYDPGHFQPPAGMNFQVAVHEPCPRIISDESDCHPAAGWDSDSVPLRRVGEVELSRVFVRVEISDALTHHEEIEAV